MKCAMQAAATGESLLDEELSRLARKDVARFHSLNQRLQVGREMQLPPPALFACVLGCIGSSSRVARDLEYTCGRFAWTEMHACSDQRPLPPTLP